MMSTRSLVAAAALATMCLLSARLVALAADAPPAVQRVLPPVGNKPTAIQAEQLSTEVKALQARVHELDALRDRPSSDHLADIGVYAKAVELALRFDEFYQPRDFETAAALLRTGRDRAAELAAGRSPWATARRLVVRGYRSRLDDSYQPYGLVIPEKLDLSKPVPLYVWLHGRGDKTTDLHFIQQRQTSRGQIAPPDGIVLHPFGRYCNAFKFAGEVDVFEAIEAVQRNYKIDADRIVLWGFSMGGAGTWHLAAHYPDRWCAASPGAGFAETRRYQNIQPKDLPPSYEQTLWHLYDVPSYTRNLFHLPVIAYSGENDKQIQAARIMEEAYAAEGHKLQHLIGPGMGHAYHPKTLEELGKLMADAARKGIDRHPDEISFQTRTLRYNRCHWLEVLGLERHWEDSRVDARAPNPTAVDIKTRNVTALRLSPPWKDAQTFSAARTRIGVDGQTLVTPVGQTPKTLTLVKTAGRWDLVEQYPAGDGLRKLPGLQGPIDDAFMEPFLVVRPAPPLPFPVDWQKTADWWFAENRHTTSRWAALFRGNSESVPPPSDQEIASKHLVLWGNAFGSGVFMKRIFEHPGAPRGIKWDSEELVVNGKTYDAKTHVLSMIYPNPLNPKKYIVLNSGPTFREGHDHTNSQQTPKLPDWAVIDVRTPPDAKRPGKIVAAGFFDERWRFQ